MRNFLYISIAALLFTSCEDVIEVEIEEGTVQLAVDAFLTSKADTQKIILLQTKQFFDEAAQSAVIADSVWVVDDLNNKYTFIADENNGVYKWYDSILVHENRTYTLNIAHAGELYTAESHANSVPVIDSINWEYVPKGIGQDNGTYAPEFVARDLVGQLDYYYIRNAKNGKFKSGRDAINICIDGTFSSEAQWDGNLFIPPYSTFSAIDFEDSLGIGDTITYEILRISDKTYNFWFEVLNQGVAGGIGALFATPTSNVRTNIVSSSADVSKTAVGWFSASMVSSYSQEIFDKPGEKLSFKIN